MLNVLQGQCLDGCLRCDPNSEVCLYCDVYRGYKTLDGKCIPSIKPNCAIFDSQGNCIVCKEGYSVDTYTYNCLETPKLGLIENCKDYFIENICSKCEDTYSLTSLNSCIKITTPIPDCSIYRNETICETCKSGFLLALDQKTCKEPKKVSNCGTYTPLKCVSCKPGFIANENNYIYQLYSFKTQKDIRLLEQKFKLDKDGDVSQVYGTCQPLNIPNCLIYASFNECTSCQSGYFLDNKKCTSFPLQKIIGCLKYSALEVCTECEQGLFLQSATICTKVDKVLNCAKYNSSADKTSCSLCEKTYFLSEFNVCSLRTSQSIIQNCIAISDTSETCSICETNFRLTDDKKKCLISIKNCQTYEQSDVSSVLLVCNICNNGYYYDTTSLICKEGSIEKCQVYSRTSNICVTCQNRRYLSGGVCKTHEDLQYCDRYQNLIKNSCSFCNDKTVLFSLQNTCSQVIPSKNCVIYKSTTECQTCEDGYFVTSDFKCQLIPANEYCKQKSGNICIKCYQNYILDNGICRKSLQHIIENCQTHTVNGLNNYEQLKCNFCKDYFLPINYKNSFVCFEQNYIINKFGFTPNDNCQKYIQENNIFVCQKCKKGYVLNNNTCVLGNTCPNGTLRLKTIQLVDSNGDGTFDSFYIDKVNFCGTQIENCNVAFPDLQQDLVNINYSCVVCKSNSFSVVSLGDKKILQKPPRFENDELIFSPLSFTNSKVCKLKSTQQLIGEENNSEVTNCELYYEMTGFGVGCLKCQHGFAGVSVNVVYQCKKFNSLTTCQECNENYYPITPYKCLRVTPIQNCVKYNSASNTNKCAECVPEYYITDGSSCIQRTNSVANCESQEPNSNLCKICKLRFIISTDKTTCYPEIYKCAKYSNSGCLECVPLYYMKNSVCYEGQVTNCAKYDPTSNIVNICIECLNSYYLTQNQCKSQPTIADCDIYGQEQGYCKKCQLNKILFLKQNKCITPVQVQYCKEYKSAESCKTCNDGYYPANYGQRCLSIPTIKNCLIWGSITEGISHNEDNCLKCSPDYLLINKKCRKWFQSVKAQCIIDTEIEDGKRTEVKCNYCNLNNSPNDIQTFGLCLEQEMIKELNPTPINNCQKFSIDSQGIQLCEQCEDNYFLLYDDNTTKINDHKKKCLKVQECIDYADGISYFALTKLFKNLDTNSETLEILAGPVCLKTPNLSNYFRSNSETNKCLYSPTYNVNYAGTGTSITKYQCIECFNNTIAVVNQNDRNFAYPLIMTNRQQRVVAIDLCLSVPSTDVNIQGSLNGIGQITNCQYYYKLHTVNKAYGCFSCKLGYNGLVKPYYDGSTLTSEVGYLEDCSSEVTACDKTKTDNLYSPYAYLLSDLTNWGITTSFASLFSGCQVCTNKTVVVFIQASTQTFGNSQHILGSYKSVSPALESAAPTGKNIVCADASTIIDGITFTGLPANCLKAVTIMNISFTTQNCIQCIPGFVPTRITATLHFVTCTAVSTTSCATTAFTIPEICETCNDLFTYSYDSTNKQILFQNDCVENSITNCLAVNNGTCYHCKSGYKLENNSCKLIQPPNCSEYTYETSIINKNMGQALFDMKHPVNQCGKCNAGFVSVINYNSLLAANNFPAINRVCVNEVPFTAPVASYTNCTAGSQNYAFFIQSTNNPLDIHCISCVSPYILTLDGKCVNGTILTNCDLGKHSSNNFCHKCKPNYISVAGVCTLSSQVGQDCVQFADSSFNTGATCIKCKDKFWLNNQNVDNTFKTSCVQYYSILTATGNTATEKIKNCAQFNSENVDRLYCVQCLPNFALLILQGDEVDGFAGYNRICLNVSGKAPANCDSLKILDQSNGQLICNKCEDTYYLTSDPDSFNVCVAVNEVPNCDEYYIDSTLEKIYQGVQFKYNYFPREFTLKCQICSTGFYLDLVQNECITRVKNVAYYNDNCLTFKISEDFCETCKENYFLNNTRIACEPAPIVSQGQGSIYNCRKMPQCSETVVYEGLHHHIDSILSCHVCKKTTEIPFIAFSGTSSLTSIRQINQYNLTGDFTNKTFKNYNGGKSVFCKEPVFTNFNIETAKFTFPTNCGVGMLNVDSLPDASDSNKITDINRTKIAVFCGACKPGYKATFGVDTSNTAITFMIGACTQIQNCQYSKAFNYCSRCQSGFGFLFQQNVVKYDNCVALPTTNKSCFAYNTTNNTCVQCCKGTYMNLDGICERINPPQCNNNSFALRNIYNLNNLGTGLFLNSEGTGCTQCKDGYFSIYQKSDYWVCSESRVHLDNQLPNISKYLKNCKNYQVVDNLLKCKKCNDGYVPRDDSGICTAVNTDLNKCILALNENSCKLCDTGFVLVNRKCVAQNINKCDIYTYNLDSQQQICQECALEHYLEANTCLPGNVTNCLRFETRKVCNQCREGFHLVRRNDGASYCYPIDIKLNCSQFDSVSFQKGILQCTKCKTNLFVINTDENNFYRTHCLKFTEITNCLKYDIQPAIGDSSFRCIECIPQFFLDGDLCKVRTNKPANCLKYSLVLNICLTCNDKFYVNKEGDKCLPYPTGVPGCRTYLNAEKCINCGENKYLTDSLCAIVPEINFIDKCLYYADKYNCEQCVANYMLKDKRCVQITATNCKTYESISACLTCSEGFGFQIDNGVKSCVSQTIPNCLSFNPNKVENFAQNYKCLICDNNFYPNNEGVCVAVTVQIPKCLRYATQDTCSLCNPTSALSTNKKNCLTNKIVMNSLDFNCKESQVLEEPLCNTCSNGFVFVEGECKACQIAKPETCIICDPQNRSLCLLCATGYYMDKNGVCQKFVPPEEPKTQPEEKKTTSTPTTKGISLLTKIAMLKLILIFFFEQIII